MTTERILCPTRGGRRSFPNQDRAIALAKERGAELVFLHISNVHFLDMTASPVLVDIESELEEMGEFLLTIAQERAEKAGVEAEIVVRHGEFGKVLRQVIAEYAISLVVLGRSAGGAGVTTPAYIESLSERLSKELGIDFVVVHEGEIQREYHGSQDDR
jgi:nucleotide-binding universal stress UspA family protein